MRDYTKFYIDGQWVEQAVMRTMKVIDPWTETPFARIALGSAADVDRAVAAARRAFESFGLCSRRQA